MYSDMRSSQTISVYEKALLCLGIDITECDYEPCCFKSDFIFRGLSRRGRHLLTVRNLACGHMLLGAL